MTHLDRSDDANDACCSEPPPRHVHWSGAIQWNWLERHHDDEHHEQVELHPERVAPDPVGAGDVLLHEGLDLRGVEPTPEFPFLICRQ